MEKHLQLYICGKSTSVKRVQSLYQPVRIPIILSPASAHLCLHLRPLSSCDLQQAFLLCRSDAVKWKKNWKRSQDLDLGSGFAIGVSSSKPHAFSQLQFLQLGLATGTGSLLGSLPSPLIPLVSLLPASIERGGDVSLWHQVALGSRRLSNDSRFL